MRRIEPDICKYCGQPFYPVTWNGGLIMPRHKDPSDPDYACEGTGKPMAQAAKDHSVIVANAEAATGSVKLNPALANSNLQNFYGE